MEKIKLSKIKGMFYPENSKELINLISGYKKASYPEGFKTRAVIVPHAGLIYSGSLAYQGISLLESDIKKIFIFAPAHRLAFNGIAISDYDYFETPLGIIKTDKNTILELKKNFGAEYFNEAFLDEHSIEIQLPLLQFLYRNIEIIPVLIGKQNYKFIEEIIEKYYQNKEYGFIISSDLSHFLSDKDAKITDEKTANMIEQGDINGFRYEQACGAIGICGLVDFTVKKGFSLIRIGMTNSSTVTKDKRSVVGYGAWALYEGTHSAYVKEFYSEFIIDIVKKSIESKLNNENININYLATFNTKGASFVTINKNDMLRGCIGSIIANRPLITDIIANARNAAFNDYRFKPVEKEELSELKYSISLLSPPVKIDFTDEDDLLSKIIENEDGIIIRDLNKQAVYLPSVWEQLPDKKEFLNSLKVKAGMSADYFSKTFEAYRFKTEYIKQI